MTALANRAYVAIGTTNTNMDIGLLSMWDALNEISEKAELDIASASTCNIGAMASTKLRITGAATITSLGTVYRGPILIRMEGALTITYNVTTLVCPGNVNIVTAAGDVLMAWPKTTTSGTSDGWQVVRLARGTNTLPIAEGGTGQVTAATAFDAIKQVATSSYVGGVELATDAEAQAGADTTRAVTAGNLKAVVLGMGQTYQDMTASRASGVTYTNSTGRAIAVSAYGTTGGIINQSAQGFVDGVRIAFNSLYSNGAGYTAFAYFIVPPGSTYSITFAFATLTKWHELR